MVQMCIDFLQDKGNNMPDIFRRTNAAREKAAEGAPTASAPAKQDKPTMSQADFSGYSDSPKPNYDRKKQQAAAEGRLRLKVQDKKY